MPKNHTWSALVALAILAAAGTSLAQRQLVDGIAAVVGDQVVLESEVDEELYLYQMRSGSQLADDEALKVRDRILGEMVDEMLLVAKARRDSIALDPGELEEEIARRVGDLKTRHGSEEAFQAALASEGLTQTDLEAIYRDDIERRLLAQKVVDRDVRPKVDVTWAEVERYYEENKAEVAAVPEGYQIAGILVVPKVSEESKRAAYARLEEARARIERGEPFADVARAYSDDASAQSGGDLGTIARGATVPEFEEAAFALNPGETSGIVTTRFGFHLIQVVEKSDEGVRVRHILVRLEVTPEDGTRAAARAESLRQRALGGEDFAELAGRYSDDERTRGSGGVLGWFTPEELAPGFLETLSGIEPGGISTVLKGETGFYVLRLLAHEAPRTAPLDEIRSRLREFLTNQRLEEEYRKLIDKLSGEIYVDVRSRMTPEP